MQRLPDADSGPENNSSLVDFCFSGWRKSKGKILPKAMRQNPRVMWRYWFQRPHPAGVESSLVFLLQPNACSEKRGPAGACLCPCEHIFAPVFIFNTGS